MFTFNQNRCSFSPEYADFSFIKLLRKLSSVKASSKEEILKELFNYYEKITDYDIWILLRQIYDTHISSRSPPEIKLLVTLIDSLINRKYHKIYQVKNGYSEFIKKKIKQFHLDNSTTLAQYIINFEPTDFGVYKPKGDEIYLLAGDGYRNALAKSPLLKASMTEEVRYLYIIEIPEINTEICNKIKQLIEPLHKYLLCIKS